MGRLKDRVAFVAGAGSLGPGIGNGKAAAIVYAREGAKVFALDIDADAVEETRRLIEQEGHSCIAFAGDAADEAAVAAAVGACIASLGRIDVLHNNVGIADIAELDRTSVESWDRVMAANLRSMFLACKHTIPHMQRQGGGAIVNIASIAAYRWSGAPYFSYYASKSGVLGYTKALAGRYGKSMIRANCISPGIMDTPMVRTNLARFYDADIEKVMETRARAAALPIAGTGWDVAHAALFLASDEARYITGAELVVDGGYTCLVPPLN